MTGYVNYFYKDSNLPVHNKKVSSTKTYCKELVFSANGILILTVLGIILKYALIFMHKIL